jgi:DNA (cytosine-5)-methyltransferase 1
LVPVAIRTAQTSANGHGIAEGVAHTLDQAQGQAVAFSIMPMNSGKDYKARETDVAQPLMAGGPVGGNQGGDFVAQAVAFAPQAGGKQTTLGYDPESDICQTLGANQTPAIAGMSVRRLFPVECEKLQGFPPGYTDVPFRGKPAADGPRYKALGNSMAVNVMRHIGQRIALVESITEVQMEAAA